MNACICFSFKNVTHIFNVYGTTEVSSWSTCHAVSEADLQRSLVQGAEENRGSQSGGEGKPEKEEDRVPLGEPLLGTLVEVRKELSSGSEKGGFGEIYLGKRA